MPEVMNGDVGEAVARSNQERMRRLLDRLLEMDPVRFEHLVGQMLDRLGFEKVFVVERTAHEMNVWGTNTLISGSQERKAVRGERGQALISGRRPNANRGR